MGRDEDEVCLDFRALSESSSSGSVLAGFAATAGCRRKFLRV